MVLLSSLSSTITVAPQEVKNYLSSSPTTNNKVYHVRRPTSTTMTAMTT
jgi:hypothetical protein